MVSLSDWKRRRGITGGVYRVDRCFPALRKALDARGWTSNDDEGESYLWDLRYAIKFSGVGDMEKISESQVYNFFLRNREFAAKSYLNVNLLSCNVTSADWQLDRDAFYPRSFDLSRSSEQFADYFKWIKCLSILKALQNYLSSHPSIDSVLISPEGIAAVIQGGRAYTKDADSVLEGHGEVNDKFPCHLWAFLEKIDTNTWTIKKKSPPTHENASFTQNELGPTTGVAVSPSSPVTGVADTRTSLMTEIDEILILWKARDAQFELTTFSNPLWVVKPSGKSRGRGVRVLTDLCEILSFSGINVVQKYIENPLLINGRKFDIRQWGLVTEWSPLGLWFYEKCYLRFAVNQYDARNRSKYIHLTNNSISKKNVNFDSEQSMMNCGDFSDLLRRNFQVDFSHIKKQLKALTYTCLACCQETVTARKNSFEMVGLDFMIDTNFHVWLLEANCSPDLSYSTPTTSDLVQKMLPDLVKVLLDVEGFCGSRSERTWGPKLLKNIYSGDFTLLRPVNRRKETLLNKNREILKIDGVALRTRTTIKS